MAISDNVALQRWMNLPARDRLAALAALDGLVISFRHQINKAKVTPSENEERQFRALEHIQHLVRGLV